MVLAGVDYVMEWREWKVEGTAEELKDTDEEHSETWTGTLIESSTNNNETQVAFNL